MRFCASDPSLPRTLANGRRSECVRAAGRADLRANVFVVSQALHRPVQRSLFPPLSISSAAAPAASSARADRECTPSRAAPAAAASPVILPAAHAAGPAVVSRPLSPLANLHRTATPQRAARLPTAGKAESGGEASWDPNVRMEIEAVREHKAAARAAVEAQVPEANAARCVAKLRYLAPLCNMV